MDVTLFAAPIAVCFVLLLLLSEDTLAQLQCGYNQKRCGDECIGIRDFCTFGTTGAKCGVSRECDDESCVKASVSCNPAVCPSNHKRCYKSGKCIQRGDNCCSFLETECADGDCVSYLPLTDRHCECPVLNNFHCDNKHCVDRYAACDGVRDCTDGSDEIGCTTPPPHIINTDDDVSPLVNNSVVIFSCVAGVVIIILLVLCAIVCSRRKPNRNRYWRRREMTFTQQSPAARTAETLVRNTRSATSATTGVRTQAIVSGGSLSEPYHDVQFESPIVNLPPYEEHTSTSTSPAALAPQPSSDDNDLPPSYDDVIKDTAANATQSNDTNGNS